MRRTVAASTAALSVLLLASCGSSSNGSSTTSPASTSTATASAATAGGITISGFAFSGTLTVKPGQKVTVTNKDSVAHPLTDLASNQFDTGNIPAGGTGTFTAPAKPGSYPFGCRYHSNMKGTLTVQG